MPTAGQQAVDALCDALPTVAWSIRVRQGGRIVVDVDPHTPLRIACAGKILLLVAAAERIVDDPAFAQASVPRPPEPVADSGLWQHLSAPSLTVQDACVLIGGVSDNLATNGLLEVVGLDACNAVSRSLGCTSLRLHDRVRDTRSPEHPACLATGGAADLEAVVHELRSPAVLDRRAASMVAGWLSLNVDHSMALHGLGLDPLVDGRGTDPPIANKTGTDAGVRADAGIIGSGADAVTYAVIANWVGESPPTRAVLDTMNRLLAQAGVGA